MGAHASCAPFTKSILSTLLNQMLQVALGALTICVLDEFIDPLEGVYC